jgi:hypothetical protein
MDGKKNTCLCRNSVKLLLLDYLNKLDTPIEIFKLISNINVLVRGTNTDLNLDDNFLNTYIQSIIEDLIESKSM